MRKRLLTMLVLLAAVVTGSWADGIVCTASDLGKVLCTDGSIYENVSAATTAGKTAAAVIVYVDETNKKGLAIALADEGSMNWSTAMSTCEGKTAITGVKWCLPSQDQWMQMFKANGGTTASYAGLNTTIKNAGGETLQGDALYWLSSESNPGVKADDVYLVDGDAYWGNANEGFGYRVRACLAFAPPSYAVTLAEGTEDADKWTIPAEAEEGATVTATYSGTRKVKSVKAVKKAAASLIVNPKVGQIIGSDGINYDANATLPDGVTKVAMIAYVGNDAETSTTYNHGLALALEDVSSTNINWCSQTSVTCLGTQYVYDGNSNTEFNDLAGIANTDALVGHDSHTHAAAKAARDYNSGTHPAGTSAWFLPSAGQWDKMATAAGSYANLITNAGLQGDEFSAYWSSTECDAEHAWFFIPKFGGWNLNNKDGGNLVRACLAF